MKFQKYITLIFAMSFGVAGFIIRDWHPIILGMVFLNTSWIIHIVMRIEKDD